MHACKIAYAKRGGECIIQIALIKGKKEEKTHTGFFFFNDK